MDFPQKLPCNHADEPDPSAWIEKLAVDERLQEPGLFLEACRYVDECFPVSATASGSGANDLLYKGRRMVATLATLELDDEALLAALVYQAVRDGYGRLDEVTGRFGDEVGKLVEGVLQMDRHDVPRLQDFWPRNWKTPKQLEDIRHTLVTMIDDPRVVVIKLAERICALHAAGDMPEEKRLRMAHEVDEIYAPIASHMGIGQLSWQLQDLAFFHLRPQAYLDIFGRLDERREQRQDYVDNIVATLKAGLAELDLGVEMSGRGKNNPVCDVAGRVKHIFSIWKKMQRKGIGLNEVFDALAVRVLVPGAEENCYRVRDYVHDLWKPLSDEIDDYIESPKPNGYRSLHTAVLGPGGKVVEIQIRNYAMHNDAELGVCAHWRYKDGVRNVQYENKILWLKNNIRLWDAIRDPDKIRSYVENPDDEVVYVLTAKGEVLSLSAGSTPVDFAYRLHTEIGNHCSAARINGRMASLNTRLENGDQVEILVSDAAEPHQEWLNPRLGFIHNRYTQDRVRTRLRKLSRENDLTPVKYWVLMPRLPYQRGASVSGDARDDGPRARLGKCCRPEPQKPKRSTIVGVVGNKKGDVVIHYRNCPYADGSRASGRIILDAYWANIQESLPHMLRIQSEDRVGLVRDICTLIADHGGNIHDISTARDERSSKIMIKITIHLEDIPAFDRLLQESMTIPGIIRVRDIKMQLWTVSSDTTTDHKRIRKT